jgi:hypothetical protein
MNGTARFPPDHAHQSWMRMSQRIDRDATKKIEILAPIRIVHSASAPARKYNRWALVRIHQMPRLVHPNPGGRDSFPSRDFSFCHF